MPFDLCNALATFMRLMNKVLWPLFEDFMIVYLDDILAYSNTWEEYVIHIMKVRKVLQKNVMRLNLKKCEIRKQSLVYLSFVVSVGELKVNPEKVRVIKNWPNPKMVTKVWSFMGACRYVRKFMTLFSNCSTSTRFGKSQPKV